MYFKKIITFELDSLVVYQDAELLSVRFFVKVHVFDCIEDFLLADLGRSGRHFDHVRRLDVRQLTTVLLTRWNRAQLKIIKRYFISNLFILSLQLK